MGLARLVTAARDEGSRALAGAFEDVVQRPAAIGSVTPEQRVGEVDALDRRVAKATGSVIQVAALGNDCDSRAANSWTPTPATSTQPP